MVQHFVFLKVNNGLFFFFLFFCVPIAILSSNCPVEVFSVQSSASGNQSHGFFLAIFLWNPPSFFISKLDWLFSRPLASMSFWDYALPLSLEFSSPFSWIFLFCGSQVFIFYHLLLCFDGVSPPLASSFIYFLVLKEHFL